MTHTDLQYLRVYRNLKTGYISIEASLLLITFFQLLYQSLKLLQSLSLRVLYNSASLK